MADRQTRDTWHHAFASRIRALRKAAGLTQEQLSERAGIATQYLSRLETARQVPTLDTIVGLAEGLDTTPSALLADPQQETQAELLSRIAAVLGPINPEDAEFLESHLMGLVTHLKRLRGG